MRAQRAVSMAVFGNPTLDEVYLDGKIVIVPGGSAFYVSAASAFLGAKVDLVGNVGNDYPSTVLRWLKNHGVGLRSLRNTEIPTTRFELRYRDSSRTLRLLQPGRQVVSVAAGHWDAVHIGPVFGEVRSSMVQSLRHRSKFISVDIQGFLRDSTRKGVVRLLRRDLTPVLSACHVVKASFEEAKVQTGEADSLRAAEKLLSSGPRNVIITRAGRGAILAVKRVGLFQVPAYPENVIVDPTGAGDGFVGGWVATMISTKDPVWAASVGSAFASLMLRNRGTRKFGFLRRELAQRSAWVYRRVRRVS